MQLREPFNTGVDARNDDAVLMRSESGQTWRVRGRSLAARAAAVLLAAVSALVALPLQAQAQIELDVKTFVEVGEGHQGGLDISLKSAPTSDVTVNVVSNDTGTVTVSPASFIFTPLNWFEAQGPDIIPVQDADTTDDTATLTLSGIDVTTITVTVRVVDDDLVLTLPQSTVALDEEATAIFAVTLASEPDQDRTVYVDSNDIGAVTAQPTSMVFGPGNWNHPQTVTVTGVPDLDLDDERVTITLHGPGVETGTVTVDVTDDDTPPVRPPTTVGGGGGGSGGDDGGGSGDPGETAPDAPGNLLAEGGNRQVTLTWEAPEDDGGSAVTDYQYRIDGTGDWTSTGSTDTTHTVTGLDSGTEYTFEVRAVNRNGESRASRRVEAAPRMRVTLDFAHFPNGAGMTSEIVLMNVSLRMTRPALYFYDRGGDLMDPASVLDVTGDLEVAADGSLTVHTAMEPLRQLTITSHGRGEMASGSMRVVSDVAIGAWVRYSVPGVGVAGAGASQPVYDAIFPIRGQEGGTHTGVALHNLGEGAMEVGCRLMQGGAVLEEARVPLAANGQDARFIQQIFTGADTSDLVGTMRCSAGDPFTAMALEIDAANRTFTTLPVMPVSRPGSRNTQTTLDFAHFANGAGIVSDLVFVNLSTQASRRAPSPFHSEILPSLPALYFYDEGGDPIDPALVVDLTGDLGVTENGALTVQTEMAPLGVLTISTHGRGELLSGSVKVASEGSIGGLLRFDIPGIGVAAGRPPEPVGDAVFPVRRREGGINTGIALHNLESSPELVRCALMREGVRLDAASIALAANGQDARFIDEMFTVADTSDFVGLVRCHAVAEGLFTAVVHELDPGAHIFITVPAFPVVEAP